MKVTVIVKCVACGRTREIQAGELGKYEFPVCDLDGMPMLPDKAVGKMATEE